VKGNRRAWKECRRLTRNALREGQSSEGSLRRRGVVVDEEEHGLLVYTVMGRDCLGVWRTGGGDREKREREFVRKGTPLLCNR
jgi:hypothetical protein